jgi:tRNA A37 methylthiotransferase MiaB
MFSSFFPVFIETYGCQMNVNDTEVVWSILEKNGFKKAADLGEVPQFYNFQDCIN